MPRIADKSGEFTMLYIYVVYFHILWLLLQLPAAAHKTESKITTRTAIKLYGCVNNNENKSATYAANVGNRRPKLCATKMRIPQTFTIWMHSEIYLLHQQRTNNSNAKNYLHAHNKLALMHINFTTAACQNTNFHVKQIRL